MLPFSTTTLALLCHRQLESIISLDLFLSLVSPNKRTSLLLQNEVDEALTSILVLRFKNWTKPAGLTSSIEIDH